MSDGRLISLCWQCFLSIHDHKHHHHDHYHHHHHAHRPRDPRVSSLSVLSAGVRGGLRRGQRGGRQRGGVGLRSLGRDRRFCVSLRHSTPTVHQNQRESLRLAVQRPRHRVHVPVRREVARTGSRNRARRGVQRQRRGQRGEDREDGLALEGLRLDVDGFAHGDDALGVHGRLHGQSAQRDRELIHRDRVLAARRAQQRHAEEPGRLVEIAGDVHGDRAGPGLREGALGNGGPVGADRGVGLAGVERPLRHRAGASTVHRVVVEEHDAAR